VGWVLLAITAATAVGVGAERRFGAGALALSRRIIDLMVWVLLPFIAFFVVAHLDLHGGVGVGLLLGYVAIATVGLLAYLGGTRLLRLGRPQVGALVCGVILANTGYLGIPLNAALLGRDALGPAIAWDTAVSSATLYTAAFAVGAAFGSGAGETRAQRVRAFFTRNPVLYALVAGLLAPQALAPHVLVRAAETLSFTLLPLGFFILGVNLMGEEEWGSWRFPPVLNAPVAVAMLLRLAVAPGILLGLAALTISVPHAYVVQAAMPTGINSLIVAHLYGLDLRLGASIIAWTTLVAVLAALALSVVV